MDGFMSGQAIYQNFANSSLAELSHGAAGTALISASYQDRAQALKSLAIYMDHAWQGEAGSAAQRGAGPLAIEHEAAAPEISNAARSMQQQVDAFETARNSVVPVPDMPEKPGFWDNIFSAGQANAKYEQRVAASQAANEHNIAVMRAYDDATRQNQALLTGIPQALNPPNPGNGGEPSPVPGPAPGPWPGPARILPSGGGSGGSGGGGAAVSGARSTAQWSAPQASPTGRTGLGETHPDFAQSVPPLSGPAEVGLAKSVPQSQLPGGPGPGLPLRGGLGPVDGGSGSGADPRRAGGPGADGGRFGGRGGLGARGSAGTEAAAGRGAAGAAGRGGLGGAPGGAGARSQNDEDGEHWRPSFLVEPDPDETFGTDEVTAPSVIGE
jgi:hypothetical protein